MKLVTAIMPTRGRPILAAHALKSFLDQSYPKKQLLILDDTEDPSFADPPNYGTICYLRADGRLSIPAKRNMLCSLASGELICHFDDDDWSDRTRISEQVKRLTESNASVTGFHSMLFFELGSGMAAKFTGDRTYALGTSLMYSRAFWKAHPFRNGPENPNVGEDNQFVGEAVRGGEFISVDAGQVMVARAHPGNTSPKEMAKFHPVPFESITRAFFS